MGPDDFHPGINNNAFLNSIVRINTEFARPYSIACGSGPVQTIPDEWLHKVNNLYIPYSQYDYIYQFEGFESGKHDFIDFIIRYVHRMGFVFQIWNSLAIQLHYRIV